ncbi:hypothetical protein A3860_22260 [Niastella vici]|uniref:Secretion system C-terminal sorting domain-containing protein n=1 Tax=Niastella vici TaxID=1703345 RepID=A0A1V9G0L9_9BACT|nr:choice-of-anchor tandem repeat GloVer-containing protein [Niastella vici]OQP64132.1 hypothetical protein A3860_22260 [Niastella vici]
MSEAGGPQDVGYIFKYDVSANSFTKAVWLNKAHAVQTYFGGIFKADSTYLYSIKSQNDSVDKATIVRFNRKTNLLEKLYTFDPAYYGIVSSTLTEFQGKYYGVVTGGYSAPYNPVKGIIFEWDPLANTVTNKFYFNATSNGSGPRGELILYNNKLYGTTMYGGASDNGVLFEFDPLTNVLVKKADFLSSASGQMPDGFLQMYNGKFYGLCVLGGAASKGTLFEYDISTGTLTKTVDLPASAVWGKTAVISDKLYTSVQNGNGIFEFDLTQKTVASYRPYINGFSPLGTSSPLYLHNGLLFGVAQDNWLGSDSSFIYSWSPRSGFATRVAAIELGREGRTLYSPVAMVNNKFYGVTEYGSVNGRGCLFEVDPVAGSSTVKAPFGAGIDGYSDFNYSSNLLLIKNRFYGTTEKGGLYDLGFLYSLDPVTGNVTRIHDFKTGEPSLPFGHLTSPSDRELFGLTWDGAIHGSGGWDYHYLIPDTVFTFLIESGTYTPEYYYHGAPQPYLGYSYRVYITKPSYGAQPAGIYMCYPTPAQQTPTWYKVFDFPVNITFSNEKGLVELNNNLFGLGTMVVNSVPREVIYKYNLLSNAFSYNVLPYNLMKSPFALVGSPVELNHKTYMLTASGCYGYGSLIEWDNVADTAAEYCLENQYIDGKVLGSLTLANGCIYGYGEKGIVCFDPVAKTFKMRFKTPAPLVKYLSTYDMSKQLTLTQTNALPLFGSIDSINICLSDSLSRDLVFTVTDADQDALKVTSTYTDSVLIRSCNVRADTINGNVQYTLQVKTDRRLGTAAITISATDTYGGTSSVPVSLTTMNRQVVSLTLARDTICKIDTTIAFTGGLPAGGVYKVDGIPASVLKPGLLTEGAHTMKYVYPALGGCQDSASRMFYITECIVPDPASPDSTASSTPKPYPNPSSGIVKLDNNEQLLTTINVYNGQGFRVYTKVSADNIIELNLSSLQTGIYYIQTVNSKGTTNARVEIVK